MLQLHRFWHRVGLVDNLMLGVCFPSSPLLCIPSDLLFANGHIALSLMARTDTAPPQLYPEPTALGSIIFCHPLTLYLPQLQPGRSLAAAPWIDGHRGQSREWDARRGHLWWLGSLPLGDGEKAF